MSQPDPKGFIEKFTRVWASPEPDTFADLWADGGVLLHPTMESEQISWDGVDRFTLDGDRAIEGIAHFDTSPMWARMGASPEEGDLLEAADRRREQQVAPA
jgi:hypothetical protein